MFSEGYDFVESVYAVENHGFSESFGDVELPTEIGHLQIERGVAGFVEAAFANEMGFGEALHDVWLRHRDSAAF